MMKGNMRWLGLSMFVTSVMLSVHSFICVSQGVYVGSLIAQTYAIKILSKNINSVLCICETRGNLKVIMMGRNDKTRKNKRLSQECQCPLDAQAPGVTHPLPVCQLKPWLKPTKCLQMKQELLEVLTAEVCQLHCQRNTMREEQKGMETTCKKSGTIRPLNLCFCRSGCANFSINTINTINSINIKMSLGSYSFVYTLFALLNLMFHK